jgi:hypothetical protein
MSVYNLNIQLILSEEHISCKSISCKAISREPIYCDTITCDPITCDPITCDPITCDTITCDTITCDTISDDHITCILVDNEQKSLENNIQLTIGHLQDKIPEPVLEPLKVSEPLKKEPRKVRIQEPEKEPVTHPLTCVSGFWPVKNKHGNKFMEWFKTTLKINCPYVFFSTKEGIEIIKIYRKNLPTYYIECNIEEFYSYKYMKKMRTHPVHCPSVELNLIWNEKIILIDKAHRINPFNSEFFCWVDAGVCTYRSNSPPTTSFPNISKLNQLPKDKIIYSTSSQWKPNAVTNNSYYHHISGASYILHKDIITFFTDMYKAFLKRIFTNESLSKSNIWTDQVILTHIFKIFPHKFYKLCDGYGMPLITLQ